MKINEVIGQREVWQRLVQMADEHRLPHAMLFCGPEGCGKMAVAMAFASYLLGEREGAEEGAHSAASMLKNWQHPDLHFTYPTIKKASMAPDYQPVSEDYTKEWREMLAKKGPYFQMADWLQLIGEGQKQAIITGGESDSLTHKLTMTSSLGGYKVNVMWLPERMNQTAANKILKLLEEPPRQTVFLWVSEQPELLLETIRSRTQRIDFKKIDDGELEQALQQRRGLDPDTAYRIARLAGGNYNRAIEELNVGNDNRKYLDLFIMLMRLAYMRNIHDLKKWSEVVASTLSRDQQREMLDYFCRMLRESFMFNFRQPELVYMTQEEENFTKNFARFINEANVIDIFQLFEESKRYIGQNANAKILFFDMALKIIVLLIRK